MNNYNDPYEYDDTNDGEGCFKSLLTLVVILGISAGIVILLLRFFTGK